MNLNFQPPLPPEHTVYYFPSAAYGGDWTARCDQCGWGANHERYYQVSYFGDQHERNNRNRTGSANVRQAQ